MQESHQTHTRHTRIPIYVHFDYANMLFMEILTIRFKATLSDLCQVMTARRGEYEMIFQSKYEVPTTMDKTYSDIQYLSHKQVFYIYQQVVSRFFQV